MRVDHQARPLAVTSSAPRFSWVHHSDFSPQHSYRLRVWQQPGATGEPIWDSGDVVRSDGLGADYAGPRLTTGTRFFWQVSVTDGAGRVADSVVEWFETAPDFGAVGRWIAGPATTGDSAEPVLSKTFTVVGEVASARLYACGLGLHRLRLNGQPVNDHRLSPPFTHFDKRVLYVPTDVTSLLNPGETTLEIALGRGFYALPTPNVWHWHQPPWKDDLRAIAELHLVYADGSTEILGTDETWSCRSGGTTFDCLYAGESFDAQASGDPQPVRVVSGPDGILQPQRHEPVRVTWSGTPTWTQVGDSWVADFGRTMAGWASLRTDQPAGRPISLTYAEVLESDGTVRPVNQHIDGDRFQRDEYIGDGAPDQRWEPSFTYKGFRYVQLDGLAEPPREDTLTAHLAHNDVDQVGFFSCSEPLFERFERAMARTVLNNLHHIPTDTPVYEKNGWTGDAQLGTETMLYQFGMRGLFAKWLDDLADSQRADGSLPVISPTAGWGYTDLGPSPEWTTVYPFVLRQLYRWYGDEQLVHRHWKPLKAYLGWELGKLVDGVAVSELGDYLQPGTHGNGPDDSGVTATAFLIRALRHAAELAQVVDDAVAGEHFRQQERLLTAALNATYLHPDGSQYVVGDHYSQTSNAVPLVFGLVPTEQVQTVADRLADDVRARGNRHNVGCIGANTLLKALSDNGHADVALAVARQTEYPSWGFWFEHGADTMWEMWETTARSRNHYFHGTVAQWLIEDVAGLRAPEQGWRTFEVSPRVIGDLDRAGHRIETVRGTVASGWTRNGSDLTLEIQVPSGATATVSVPGSGIQLSGGPSSQRTPVLDQLERGFSSFVVGTGRWSFSSRLAD
ncbi:hypothetical protein GCM10009841_18530 [Microlunatus panaciterrae]|uniref:alpha-L-rhamnosidase n=1 Tax=Microlunatus panaciterrae TaxID=400768 RepID=A0ABS2RN25_9ACTN|nr:alpha-L-rhamnosidase [Microlunatus panaciterrae]MBM7800411.1 alpha-L-rhamnosidase [Microlunatus panaciterrae]